MKKKLISAFTATAMVATVVPAAVTQAAPATLKIDSVVAVDSNNVKVTYTVNQKKYTETVKTSKTRRILCGGFLFIIGGQRTDFSFCYAEKRLARSPIFMRFPIISFYYCKFNH